jgi:hypothetical protein
MAGVIGEGILFSMAKTERPFRKAGRGLQEPGFLKAAMGFQVAGFRADAEGLKEFLMGLERSVVCGKPTQTGLVFSSEQRHPD